MPLDNPGGCSNYQSIQSRPNNVYSEYGYITEWIWCLVLQFLLLFNVFVVKVKQVHKFFVKIPNILTEYLLPTFGIRLAALMRKVLRQFQKWIYFYICFVHSIYAGQLVPNLIPAIK